MRLMLSWLVLAVILVFTVFPNAYGDISSTGTVIRNDESINCGECSNNTSGLQVKEHTILAQSPKLIVIGKGYYASHPISYDSQTGQKTWMKSKDSGVSVNHEVSSAHNLSQTLDMSAQGGSYQDGHVMTANGGVGMNVAENVQEGKVSIGVLKGGTNWDGQPPSATALRNPSLDIEEDYIGNFHIEQNLTLQSPIQVLRENYSWLPCCSGGFFDITDLNRSHNGAESVFDYMR
jgi:hypothetical protein